MRTSKQLLTAITLLAALIIAAYIIIYKFRQHLSVQEEAGLTAFEMGFRGHS